MPNTGKYPKVLSWKLDTEPSVSVTNAHGNDDAEDSKLLEQDPDNTYKP